MKTFRFWFVGWALLALMTSSQAVAQFSLEGIYTGTMTLYDGEERTIPLDLSLTMTGETYVDPDGDEMQIIDGAFVIDEEGGPYSFTRISFDLDDGRVDMRYNRPSQNFTEELPSSFRLTGYFGENGGISGRVLSGIRGPIGTFELVRTESFVLPTTSKYLGVWEGAAQLTDGGEMPFRVVLNDALVAFTNPPNYEFEYTPGKIGHIRWNQTRLAISNVSIDYLRRRIVLHKTSDNGSTDLSIEFELDFDSGAIQGQINSAFRGRTATFALQPR